MHERYWFLSDVFALIFVICFPKKWGAFTCVTLPSLYVLCKYLFSVNEISLSLLAILLFIGIAPLAVSLYEEVKDSLACPAEGEQVFSFLDGKKQTAVLENTPTSPENGNKTEEDAADLPGDKNPSDKDGEDV